MSGVLAAGRQDAVDLLTRAARNTADLAVHLGPADGPVRVLHRGRHPFWDVLVGECLAAGRDVYRDELDDEDHRWSLPRGHEGPGVSVCHDPFGPASEPVDVAALRRAGRLLCIDFPHGLSDDGLGHRLVDLYLAALAVPWRTVDARSRALAGLLADVSGVVVRDEGGVLSLRAPWAVRTDLGSYLADVPIVQVPLGEAWLALDPANAEGSLHLRGLGGVSVTVRGGTAHVPGPAGPCPDPVVELGFGTNPRARHLPGTVLAEKGAGTAHVGMGDNSLLGGQVTDDHHHDLPLPPTASIEVSFAHDPAQRLTLVGPGATWVALRTDGADAVPVVTDGGAAQSLVGGRALEPPQLLGREVVAPSTPIAVHGEAAAPADRTNARALSLLADATVGDLLALAEQDSGLILGRFGQDSPQGLAGEKDMTQVWDILVEGLGPLPWPAVTVLAVPAHHPRGLSLPGVVLVDRSLVDRPLTLRWLYVVHELVHQWLGNAVLLPSGHAATAEPLVDALAVGVATSVLPPSARGAFVRQAEAYAGSGDDELRLRAQAWGRHLLRSDADGSGLFAAAARLLRPRTASARDTGLRDRLTPRLLEELTTR